MVNKGGKQKVSEETLIKTIERSYLKHERKNIYIAGENLNFVWSLKEVSEIKKLIKEGKSPQEIAEKYDRKWKEVVILAWDFENKGRTGKE